MKRPQFSLKRLFATVTLLAAGLAVLSQIFRTDMIDDKSGKVLLFWVGGGMLMGAGILTPFRKTLLGAVLGLIIQVLLLLLFICALAPLNGI